MQTLQGKVEEERKKSSRKLEATKKLCQKEKNELQRKNKELTVQIAKTTASERQEKLEYHKKIEAVSKAKENLLEKNNKKFNVERSKSTYLLNEIERLKSKLKERPERKYKYSA